MQVGKEACEWRTYLRSVWIGCLSVPLLFLILMIAAAAADKVHEVFEYKALASKICLGICALLCGILSARKNKRGQLAHAMAGECVLFLAVVLCGLSMGKQEMRFSLLIAAGIVLIGGFAGALLSPGPRIQRRGKR